MHIAAILVGFACFGIALPTNIYIAQQMYGWTLRQRARVATAPALGITAFFVTVFLSVGPRWWMVPIGVLGASLLGLVIPRATDRREFRPARQRARA